MKRARLITKVAMKKDRTTRRPNRKKNFPKVEPISISRMNVRLSKNSKTVVMTRSGALAFASYLKRTAIGMRGKKVPKK